MANNQNSGTSNITWNDVRINESEINRDSMHLVGINENGTIADMIQTINSNFLEIARHGGGPAGFDGLNGIDGVDGVNAEFIYALCDSITDEDEGTKYPVGNAAADLFNRVNQNGDMAKFGNVEWWNHPQGVSLEHKNEYVMARYRRSIEGEWFYSKPALWSHWGETGRDGDGVEYIFLRVDHELSDSEKQMCLVSKSGLNQVAKVIYNMDDFFPGSLWFNTTNENAAWVAVQNAGISGVSQSSFKSRFENPSDRYGLCVSGYDWTDNPKGTTADLPYEYVAIRRCTTDASGKKEWSKYSVPALWATYSKTSRTFIVYKNTAERNEDENGIPRLDRPVGGHWNTDTDVFTAPTGWNDKDVENPNYPYTWISSGIFDKITGELIGEWSNPICITGPTGEKGADGTDIEFIYALINADRPIADTHYPTDEVEIKDLFDTVERDKTFIYKGIEWCDNAQPISPEDPTEYMWVRQRKAFDDERNPIWTYAESPVIWAHWGEDGTDGDGVEYIFKTSQTSTCTPPKKKSEMTGTIGKYAKIIFNCNDFYPDDDWFTESNKSKVIELVTEKKRFDSSLDEQYVEDHWEELKAYLDNNWIDNPKGTNAERPYEFVSIRRCDPDATPREWGDFSTPSLWSYYGKRTRVFIVFCNIPKDKTSLIKPPTGGWWDMNDDRLQMSQSDSNDYSSDALSNMTGVSGVNIGKWQDDNNDVEGTITYMANGIFAEPGGNISWSEPFRVTGPTGEKGADGTDIEFIYAMEDDPVYPTNDDDKHTLFEGVENANPDQNTGFKKYTWRNESTGRSTDWFDNAQAISKDSPIEYCWSREKKPNATNSDPHNGWTYTLKPFIWAHWGEDGTDGDGIEYIFHLNDDNELDSSLNPNVTDSTYQDYIDILYSINDFYPGSAWFTSAHSSDVKTLAENAGKSVMNWESVIWPALSTLFDRGWTDNPTGVDPENQYELVSIRKSHNDSDGKRVWEEFSTPVVWATFSKSTRVFVVYCNMIDESTPDAPHGGWWDVSGIDDLMDENDHSKKFKQDILSSSARQAIENSDAYDDEEEKPYIGYWMDQNIDVDNTIVWIATGVFGNDGDPVSWSEPHRLTGADGRPGADGSNIEFIYTISKTLNYPPKTGSNIYLRKMLFDDVEHPDSQDALDHQTAGYITIGDDNGVKYIDYRGTHWYDRAQVISPEDKIEYCASRRLPAGATTDAWIYDDRPFIWAHWGEDGTDGDGIEYIFMLSPNPISYTTWDNYMDIPDNATAKAIYSMSDFRPNSSWFDKKKNESDTKSINQEKVELKMQENQLGEFNQSHWNEMRLMFSFDMSNSTQTPERPELGFWMDNPGEVDPVNQYQYVSIRKEIDDEWGPFSEPVLWTKYYISKFTSFAFVAVPEDVKLDTYVPTGGDYTHPLPDNDTVSGVNLSWSDGPEPSGINTAIWMTSAQLIEGKETTESPVYPKWSTAKRMADSSNFQIEWSTADLTDAQIADLNTKFEESEFNFGTIYASSAAGRDFDEAERIWRNKVITYTKDNGVYAPYNQNGVRFGDDSAGSYLMATCQVTNGTWTNWVVKRIKGERGEKGDTGTSITIKRRITYEVPLGNQQHNVDGGEPFTGYDYINAESAKSAFVPNPAAEQNNLLIVYPNAMTGDLYVGDTTSDDKGGCLYMWKYDGSSWIDINNPETNGETPGNTYISPNGHLILWDSDSWQDLGNFEGPEGKRWILVVKYAKDSSDGTAKVFCDNDDEDVKYLGTLTYLDNGSNRTNILDDPMHVNTPEQSGDHVGWNWVEFRGQDGYGYEYIFKGTSTNEPPQVPDYTNTNQKKQANVIPNGTSITNTSIVQSGWKDEPIEPDAENNKFVWMCWRKLNHATGEWTPFMGKDKGTFPSGVARLWQVYARSITNVEEFFHVDINVSPTGEISGSNVNWFTSQDTSDPNWRVYWTDKTTAMNNWNKTNQYLFNREVITYSDGNKTVLDAHFLAKFDTGIKDVIDYYCLDGDGDTAPAYDFIAGKYRAITEDDWNPANPPAVSGQIEGKTFWTRNAGLTKVQPGYEYLWNISYKTYNDSTLDGWTTPHVIGVYGEGGQGEDSIYLDLDNEMDAVQISTTGQVLNGNKYETILHMHKGESLLKMTKCGIEGEETFTDSNLCAFQYRVTKDTGDWQTYIPPSTSNPTGTVVSGGFEELKMIIDLRESTISQNASNFTLDEYNKIQFIAHTTLNDADVVRRTNYILIGTTHPSIFRIVPSDNVLVEKDTNGTKSIVPNSLTIKVVEQIGSKVYERSANRTGEGGFVLKKSKNGGQESVCSSYTINTPYGTGSDQYKAEDRITLKVYVDTEDADTTPDIVLDSETIFVLKEGTDGAAGNGYQYRYARYDSQSTTTYTSTVCSIIAAQKSSTVAEPWVYFGNSNNHISTTAEPQGVDDRYTYEYRIDRTGGSTWGSWSNPILIAKYLTAEGMTSEIQHIVDEATSTISTNLTNATNRLNNFLDESGNIKTSQKNSIIDGLVDTNDLTGAINSINLAGIKVDASSTETFSTWLNNQTGSFADAKSWLNAAQHTIETAITDTEGFVATTAFQDFKADAHDKFAYINQTVANENFLTDVSGVLLVDVPEYVTWFESESDLNDVDSNGYNPSGLKEDERRNVEWVLCKNTVDNTSVYTTIPYKVNNSIAELSTIYDKTTEIKPIFLWMSNLSCSTLTSSYINNLKTLLSSSQSGLTIGVNLSDNSYSIVSNSTGLSVFTNLESLSTTTLGNSKVHLILYANATMAYDANQEEEKDGTIPYTSKKYVFGSELSWNVGIVSKSQSGTESTSLAYIKTASIYDEPVFNSEPQGAFGSKSDVFENLSIYGSNGYTLKKVSDAYYPANVNGNVTIASNSPQMYLIPYDTPLSSIMSYVNGNKEISTISGAATQISDIPNGTSNYYYVVGRNGSDDYNYSIAVNGNNTISFPYTYPSTSEMLFTNKHILGTGTTKFSDYTTSDYYDRSYYMGTDYGTELSDNYYSLYITSKYDVVNIYRLYINNYTVSGTARFNVYIDYKINNGSVTSKLIEEITTTGTSVSRTSATYDSNYLLYSDIFKGLLTSAVGKTLYFKLRITDIGGLASNSTLTVNYKFTTENKLMDSGATLTPSKISGASSSGYTFTSASTFYGCIVASTAVSISTSDQTIKTTFMDPGSNFGPQRDVLSIITVKSSYNGTRVKFTFDKPAEVSGTLQYMIIPTYYTSAQPLSTLQTFINSYIAYKIGNGGYLNNTANYLDSNSTVTTTTGTIDGFRAHEMFGVGGKSWTNVNSYPTATITFDNAYNSGSDYYYTIIVRHHITQNNTISQNSQTSSFIQTISYEVLNQMEWVNAGTNIRRLVHPMGYMIDKVQISISDRSVSDDLKGNRIPNSNDATNYLDVPDEEKPYLIPVITELATISQHISDGIASTEIITSADDKKAVFFAQAVAGVGSQIYMNANEVGIESDFFKLDKNGLTLNTAGGNTSIDSNGILHANGAIINGSITAEKFEASETKLTTVTDSNDVEFTGDLTRNTLIDGSQFLITATGELVNGSSSKNITNSIYIEIVDEMDNDNDDIKEGNSKAPKLYGVPQLRMRYNGETYALNPSMWKKLGGSTSSNMRWIPQFTGPVYSLTSDTPSSHTTLRNYCVSGSVSFDDGKTGNYYIFRPEDNAHSSVRFINRGNTNETICRLGIDNWGGDQAGNAALLYSVDLIDNVNGGDVPYFGAYTSKSLIDSYNGGGYIGFNGSSTPIDEQYQRYATFLPTGTIYGSKKLGEPYTYQWDSDEIDSTWGQQNMINMINGLMKGGTESYSMCGGYTIWKSNIFSMNGYTPYDCMVNGGASLIFDNCLLYSSNGTTYTNMRVTCYPQSVIEDNGSSINTTITTIWVKCELESHIYYDSTTQGKTLYLQVNDVGAVPEMISRSQYEFHPGAFDVNLSFDFILKMNTGLTRSDEVIKNKVIECLEKINFATINSNSSYHYSFANYIKLEASINNGLAWLKDDYR